MENVAALETLGRGSARALRPRRSESRSRDRRRSAAPHAGSAQGSAAKAPKPAAGGAAKARRRPSSRPQPRPALETGSIEHARRKVAGAAKPRQGAVGVLLATGPSVDALRLNWTILTDRHGDAVKNLQPALHGDRHRPTIAVYGLVAGSGCIGRAGQGLCQTMEQKGLACEVSAYRGNAL